MLHPDTELRFINPEIGFGVFATRLIPKGTVTWVQDELDQIFSEEKMRQLGDCYAPAFSKYSYLSGRGETILCWDLARYVNHSCAPTCLSPGYNFELAVRDIQPGEELTDDYAALNLQQSFHCLCGAPACRIEVREDDVLKLADEWDRIVRDAFPLIREVPQPLWELIEEKGDVLAASAGGAIASCKLNLRAFVQSNLLAPCATSGG